MKGIKMNTKTTEPLFIYAGHTMCLTITGTDISSDIEDFALETQSVWSHEIYEDGQNMGTYPKYFAECEALDILVGEFMTYKDSGATIDEVENLARGYVRKFISEGIFEKVGTQQDLINDLYKMGASSREIQNLLAKGN